MARLLIRQPLSSGPATLFASTIVFLRSEFGVPSARIADAFGISLANVNTIRSRGNSELGDPGLDFLLHPEATSGGRSFADRYGIRLSSRNQEPPIEAPNLEGIAEEFTRTVAVHKSSRDFLAGARALGILREHIGYPRNPRFFRLIAQIHAMRCWFFGHSGFGASALREAALAIPMLNHLHATSGDSSVLREMRDCYIAASNASLLRRRPETARMLLEKARQVSEGLNESPNSEWFRQQGTGCLQLNDIDQARQFYRRTLQLTNAHDSAREGFPGRRHLSLLEPMDWEETVDEVHETERRMGRHSLEFSVRLHWTVASGICLDDSKLNRQALDLLDQVPTPLFVSFGHQATVSYLLRLTSRLNLPHSARIRWARFLMYENAFRNC
jgi:hypothetical protein